MISDCVPYLCSNKTKTVSFSKFDVILGGGETSTVTLSLHITLLLFSKRLIR